MKKKISGESLRIEAVLASHRGIATDALTDILLDALTDVCGILKQEGEPGFEGWEFDRVVSGFRPEHLEKVYICGDDEHLLHWVMGMQEQEKMSLLMAFLNWDRIRMNDFRSRFPNSFTKWTPSDDEALLEMFAAGRTWSAMSDHFGRNVNALKLRLQHLGVDLGAEAASPRFQRRAAAAPQPQIPDTSRTATETQMG